MKPFFLMVTIVFGIASAATTDAEETPAVLADLSPPNNHWLKTEAGSTKDGNIHWTHFRKRNSRDVLAVAAWKTPKLTVTDSAVRQASIETFNHDGLASVSTTNASQPIAEVVRHQLVTIRAKNAKMKEPLTIEAIETTYIYEPEEGRSASMAHGYIFRAGDWTLFIQQTSKKVFTSETAADLAFDLVARNHAITQDTDKRWSFSISRSKP